MAKDKNSERMSALDKFNLACGIVAILLLGGALVVGNLPQSVNLPAGVRVGLQYGGYGFMALYVLTLGWLKRKDIKQAASHKHAKSGANSSVQIVAVLAILTAVNWWGTRNHMRFDLTENKQYSLAEQTVKVLKNLKDPVQVTLFIKKGDAYSENLRNLWEEYAYHGGDNLKLDVVDVDQDPMRARQENVKTYGTTVLSRGERKTTLTAAQEQDLTSGLLKVTQSGQKVIYFVTGHGELSPTQMDQRNGLSNAKEAIEKQNYKVDAISLIGKDGVPSDAAMVVVAGPEKPFLDEEVKDLEAYIEKGGRVFLSLRPQVDAKLSGLTEKYGIGVNNDIVLDPRQFVGDPASPAVTAFPHHTITQGLNTAFFSGSRSLKKLDKLPEGVNVTPLVNSSTDAWGETGFTDRNIGYTPGKDAKGPLPLVLLAEKGKGRLIVAGNTLFMANQFYYQFNNGDLFLNAMNWMADEESLIAIPPKDSAPKNVELLPWQYQGVFFGTVVLLPLSLLFAAGLVWWRRK